ncbi:hypothetical protein [Saccharopolyspora phatthalungensis]|uniref:Uncharacterized protein n=1 Tax=Saccharopolyspora phatthalungensis TaxID=664693 RepID=A0A840QE11_9PSEU|nr:hypothetical protein [Saccharopolyspora phatthalungensis]MBB5158656.1 hypothetical protein [Saccharopolyspora phatthalungensis]
MSSSDGAHDIGFHATVRARRLRFQAEPDVRVEFLGTAQGESSADRVGLPRRVAAGVTYRDVRIDYRLTASVDDPFADGPDDQRA